MKLPTLLFLSLLEHNVTIKDMEIQFIYRLRNIIHGCATVLYVFTFLYFVTGS